MNKSDELVAETARRAREAVVRGYERERERRIQEFGVWVKDQYDTSPEDFDANVREWMLRAWLAAYGR